MAQGRQRAEWQRAAAVVAKVHNCHCSDAIATEDVHPILRTGRPAEAPAEQMTMSEVGELFGHKWPGAVVDEG